MSSSLVVVIDASYTHKWFGDNYFGPGGTSISVDLILRKTYMV